MIFPKKMFWGGNFVIAMERMALSGTATVAIS
jgi:hypothetical protein